MTHQLQKRFHALYSQVALSGRLRFWWRLFDSLLFGRSERFLNTSRTLNISRILDSERLVSVRAHASTCELTRLTDLSGFDISHSALLLASLRGGGARSSYVS